MVATQIFDSITLLDALVDSLAHAGGYNRNDQTPPAVLLWTDGERQWEPLLPLLRARLPLLTLGRYAPAERSGPAYWLRCMVARTLPDDRLPADALPIIYLPGVSKQELRAVEECPRHLQPLAELQYRGALWTHRNGKDWTVAGFLQAREGGLGIEVAPDGATRAALRRALPRLAGEPLAALRHETPLRAAFLDALLNPDDVRRVLDWLNDPQSYQAANDEAEWAAFRSLCQNKYSFDPHTDGLITAAQRLAQRSGAWAAVWQRFSESPWLYPHLPELLERARPTQQLTLFDDPQVWPQENAGAEDALRRRLLELRDGYDVATRDTIGALEREHGTRRASVWATLNRAPLAGALQHLNALVEATARPLSGDTLGELAAAYTAWGWRADAALLAALASVEHSADVAAVTAAALSAYRPWLEHTAEQWQRLYIAQPPMPVAPPQPNAGTCVLFCDALRYDLAMQLADALHAQGYSCTTAWLLAALPTITATAKHAIAPVADAFTRSESGLTPSVASGGQYVTAELLRRVLRERGYQTLRGDETGDPAGRAWSEIGAIDSYGHTHGWRLARHLPDELRLIVQRVAMLLQAGWRAVTIVTDHGWLLLPGGLPKAELPEHLTELRKGRCARLKPFSETMYPTVAWRWDPHARIVSAPGVCCFEAGKEYEHGGLSPQECVVPLLTVTRGAVPAKQVTINAVVWHGLRCMVTLAAPEPGSTVDLRFKPADAATSLLSTLRAPGTDGVATLLVEDDERLGEAAVVVVLAADGIVLAQHVTMIGG